MSVSEVYAEIQQGEFDMINISDGEVPTSVEVPSLPQDCINLYDKTQVSFYIKNNIVVNAFKYLKSRNLLKAINKPDSMYISLKDYGHKNRLVLPFKDVDGKIVFYQSRKIFDWDEKCRYLSKRDSDKSLFNIDKVDSSNGDVIYMFEGPIDACFIKNGVAVAGINEGNVLFTNKQEEQLRQFKFFKVVWCLDSQYLDSASREKTKVLLESGQTVFIWPENYGKRYKDFNEMCIDRDIFEIDQEFVNKNTYSGKLGLTRLRMIN